MTKTFPFYGSVSTATHLTVDLMASFLEALDQLDPNQATMFQTEWLQLQAKRDDDGYAWDQEDELLEAIMNALDEQAPDGYYFGTHPGDGADFGFWRVEDIEN